MVFFHELKIFKDDYLHITENVKVTLKVVPVTD